MRVLLALTSLVLLLGLSCGGPVQEAVATSETALAASSPSAAAPNTASSGAEADPAGSAQTPTPAFEYTPVDVAMVVHLSQIHGDWNVLMAARMEVDPELGILRDQARAGTLSQAQEERLALITGRRAVMDSLIQTAWREMTPEIAYRQVVHGLQSGAWVVSYQGEGLWRVDTPRGLWAFHESWQKARPVGEEG